MKGEGTAWAADWVLLVDLDGTLICGGAVDHVSVDALHRFVDSGGLFVAASGRPLESITLALAEAPKPACIIGLNGAIASVGDAGEVRGLGGIPVEVASAVIGEILADERSALCVYSPAGWWSCGSTDLVQLEAARSGTSPTRHVDVSVTLDQLRQDGPILKLLGIVDQTGQRDARQRVTARVGDSIEISTSYPEYLEVTAPGVTKGSAVMALASDFPEVFDRRIAAVGDGLNDVAMLEVAEATFAMTGAHDRLVAIADHQVGPCGDGGVAEAIGLLEATSL